MKRGNFSAKASRMLNPLTDPQPKYESLINWGGASLTAPRTLVSCSAVVQKSRCRVGAVRTVLGQPQHRAVLLPALTESILTRPAEQSLALFI